MKSRRKADIRKVSEAKATALRAHPELAARDWRVVLIEAIERGASVSAAAREAGISRAQAYRRQARDADFAARWAAAQRWSPPAPSDPFVRETPIFYRGLQVGVRRRYVDAALLRVLRRAFK